MVPISNSSTNGSGPPSPLYPPPDSGSLVVACIFYVIIAVFAIFGNMLVVISFFLNDKLRTVTNYFVIGLAVADIMVGALSVPLWMYSIITYPNSKQVILIVYTLL